MRTKVQKWGNSLALRIPKSFAAEVGLDEDAAVDLTLIEGKLVVTPLTPTEYTLEELLAQVTDENIHAEIPTGHAVGTEVW
ncbi:AbrB/MazE/SpoVT family DNA-binding domain-containing protein [bacterium]|nr:AbrB/MazE/SpoVT family DNA-binding domain-containing protein [bacterium]